MDPQQKLKAKLREKTARRKPKSKESASENVVPDDLNLMQMMERVQEMLKSNPQMMQQINTCVSNVMNNKELMESLASQVQTQVQTNSSNSAEESRDALLNESKQ